MAEDAVDQINKNTPTPPPDPMSSAKAPKIESSAIKQDPLGKTSSKLPKINLDRIKEVVVNFLVPLISLVVSELLFFVVIRPGLDNIPTLKATL